MPLIGTTFAIFALFCIVITFFSVDESFHKATLEAEVEKLLRTVIATQEVALKMNPTSDKPSDILSKAFLLLGEDEKAECPRAEMVERLGKGI